MSGHLKDGKWHEGWYDTGKTAGEFVRTTSRFRSWITADGSIAYESLDVMLGRVPRLDVAALQDKMVAKRRGGYCLEQDMLFRAGLRPELRVGKQLERQPSEEPGPGLQ